MQLLPSDETEILDNLQGLSDPSKVVLDIIQNPIVQKYKMGDNAVIIDDRDVLLLKQLMRIKPHIKPCVREEAMKLALNLKSNISENTENSVAVLGFLLLMSIYGLAPSFDEDEVLKLFGFVAQDKIAVELFGTLGFANQASGMLVYKCFVSDTSYYTYFFLTLNFKCRLHVFIKRVNILETLHVYNTNY